MTRFRRTAFTRLLLSPLLALVSLLALLIGLRVVKSAPAALPAREPNSEQQWTILLDDFAPQPLQSQTFWPYNRLGGELMAACLVRPTVFGVISSGSRPGAA